MINLVPKKVEKIVTREYVVRILSVVMLALAFLFFSYSLLTSPTDFLILSLKNNVSANLDGAQAMENSYKELNSMVNETNELVDYLQKQRAFRPTSIIDKIDELSGAGVRINEFDFDQGGKSVSVTGVADSRANLSDFRNKVEVDDSFVSVDLPLSNLAKDSDITFTMTLALNISNN